MHETNGVEFATAHLATDVTLHYAERGDREGEAIIFLHGYSDSWYSFGQVLPLLSPEYDAFALTQRGHGDSDKPECCYTVLTTTLQMSMRSWTRLASSERPSSVLRREPFRASGGVELPPPR